MQLIFFSRSGGAAKTLRLPAYGRLLIAFAVMALFGSGIAAGYLINDAPVEGLSDTHISSLQQELESQRGEIDAARLRADDQLDALALRMGQMSASVIRLNALGRRLTAMANIDDAEFDFGSLPASGGPVEYIGEDLPGRMPDLTSDLDKLAEDIYMQEHQLDVLAGLMFDRQLIDKVHPSGKPVKAGYISSYYGKRTDPFTGKTAWHRGLDFSSKAGTEVVAVGAGVVISSRDRQGYGNMVEISHGNGYSTRYAHNSKNLVSVGDSVAQGDVIALVGSTGRATGPNLHFEVWHNGKHVNPRKFVSSAD
jgi:murein DD-endopeptidase MepM/ murein hydrolase activator NlpD